jgi:uncharacterized membrane protein YGL010W
MSDRAYAAEAAGGSVRAYYVPMRTASQWLEEYGDSHRNHTNKALHWICVPVIAWCVLGLMWSLPFPVAMSRSLPAAQPFVNWAGVAVLAALIYYSLLSIPLALGAFALLLAFLFSIAAVERASTMPLWSICLMLFIAAWIGQFIGHAVEGKRPSFFKDLQFLMIGPLWLLADVYRRLGIRF